MGVVNPKCSRHLRRTKFRHERPEIARLLKLMPTISSTCYLFDGQAANGLKFPIKRAMVFIDSILQLIVFYNRRPINKFCLNLHDVWSISWSSRHDVNVVATAPTHEVYARMTSNCTIIQTYAHHFEYVLPLWRPNGEWIKFSHLTLRDNVSRQRASNVCVVQSASKSLILVNDVIGRVHLRERRSFVVIFVNGVVTARRSSRALVDLKCSRQLRRMKCTHKRPQIPRLLKFIPITSNMCYPFDGQAANGLNFPIRHCAIRFLDSVLLTFVWCNRRQKVWF